MSLSVPIDTTDLAVTPLFKYFTRENVNASEREGHAVMETFVGVEVRIGGSKLYSPVFPADAQWMRDGHRIITYAERWPEQYKAFMEGNQQMAAGTPLENLSGQGITPSQLSLCRALKIYSIEGLASLEGQNLRSLGMHANVLKKMATDYLNNRVSGASLAEIAAMQTRIADLETMIASLEAMASTQSKPKAMIAIPEKEATPKEIDEALRKADLDFEAMADDDLKEWIAQKSGAGKPRGNPSHETLVSMAKELAA